MNILPADAPTAMLAPVVMLPEVANSSEHVILLHGLARRSGSMDRMATALRDAGYSVANTGYSSRTAPVHALAAATIAKALDVAEARRASCLHFVTHSMGGILVRDYLKHHRIERLGRVVMLAPPNAGSEVVDRLRSWSLFRWINGPAGQELGTDATSVPQRLGPVDFELGVIAGDRSINWINSLMITGPDDGKVSVRSTQVDGMSDHVVIHTTHPFIMKNRTAIRQTLMFLRTGAFEKTDGHQSQADSSRTERR